MSTFQKRPCYCYSINTGEFFSFESIYSGIMELKGEYRVSWCGNVIISIDSPPNRKLSSLGYVWFDKKEGVDIVQPNEIYCALNYRYSVMNHPGQVNWANLAKAHEASRTAIVAYNSHGEELFYSSITEAAEDFGTPVSNISRVLRNQNKGKNGHHAAKARLSACGWYFKYA